MNIYLYWYNEIIYLIIYKKDIYSKTVKYKYLFLYAEFLHIVFVYRNLYIETFYFHY